MCRLDPCNGLRKYIADDQLDILGHMCDATRLLAILAGATGGAIAIGGMEAFSARASFPLVAIPFATSIVTVLGSPQAEPAQPRALIGGHLLSTFVGLLTVKLFGPAPWAAALAVGLAMVAMHLTGTFHPPAGIDPLVVVVDDMSWSFLVAPVGIGVQFSRNCSPLPGTAWSHEGPTGVIRGLQSGGEARAAGQSAFVPSIAAEGRTSDGTESDLRT